MFRTVIALLILTFTLAACGGSVPETNSPESDFEGTWTVVDNSNGIDLVATIEGEEIEIDWLLDDNQSALYWKGSFPTDKDAELLSHADTKALDDSVMGSGDESKLFRFEENELRFELTALGHTQTIRMHK